MQNRRGAFTLVELLVVIAILGGLLAVLLPAVGSARESGRRSCCQNNLRQLSGAIELHRSALNEYPYGGWGQHWVGVPNRGSGKQQPGGWAYNVLPFLEYTDLHDSGSIGSDSERKEAYSRRLSTPLEVFNCATRRDCRPWHVAAKFSYAGSPKPSGVATEVARSDYAINAGASHVFFLEGPANIAQGEDPTYWRDVSQSKLFTGVSHLRIAAKPRSFEDGCSKTYLVGEKTVEPSMYESGLSFGDNESLYSGYSNDLHRFTGLLPSKASTPWCAPVADTDTALDPPTAVRFGSAHASGFNMAFCDGSLQFIEYGIDQEVHLRLGHRRDGGEALANLN